MKRPKIFKRTLMSDVFSRNMSDVSSGETYEAIAEAKGVRDTQLFAEFMRARFGSNETLGYAQEWADRFNKGPERFMDKQSLELYRSLK